MSGFSKNQLRQLTRKLDRKHVHSRSIDGRSLDYIEGWFALSEANQIFGYAGWDREMVHFERVFDRSRGDAIACGYVARVRVRVRAGTSFVTREGTGFGQAAAKLAGDAHERALKSAETDATKRALATFGNRFGLALYDKEQAGVSVASAPESRACQSRPSSQSLPTRFELVGPDGGICASDLSPEAFCTGVRQLIEASKGAAELQALKVGNWIALQALRSKAPTLLTSRGEHYADVLERLIAKRQSCVDVTGWHESARVSLDAPSTYPLRASRLGQGPVIDKSRLSVAGERRVRSKSHLVYVASKPCLICEDAPSQAHHLTFAQARGLSLKASDEFTVPLCVIHHNELHRAGGEVAWWRSKGMEPLPVARALWAETLETASIAEDGIVARGR